MAIAWSDVAVPTTAGKDFRDFAEDTGHAILCGVGGTGLCYTTPDCVTYTARTLAENNNMRGIAYAPTLGTAGRLCAVSSNGTNRVQYSDDGGVTWTAVAASSAIGWQSIAWVSWLNGGAGWFVAVASSGNADGTGMVMTSPDGTTWTARNATNPRRAWSGLAVSSTTLVAVDASSGTQCAMTSTDAITWTLQTTSAAAARQIGTACGSSFVAYSPLLTMFAYVAVLDSGGARFLNTSIDNGVTWVTRAFPTDRIWTGIRWFVAGARWIIPSQSTPTYIAESTDGVTITESSTGLTNRFWDCIGALESANKVVSWGQSVNTHMLTGHLTSFDSLTPAFGTKRGGTVVTLTGVGFTGVTSVTFGGTAAVSIIVNSDTSITCVTPPHAIGLVDVVVTGVGTRTSAYSFVSVDRVSPKAGTVAGGIPVTITGFGFTAATAVLFDDIAATSPVIVSNLEITAVTPAHASGVVDVTVSGVDTGSDLYTYTLGVPQNLGKGLLLPPLPTRTPFLS